MLLKILKKTMLVIFMFPLLSNAQPEIGIIISKTNNSEIDFIALAVRDTVSKKISFLRGAIPDNVELYANTKKLMSRYNTFRGIGIRLATENDCHYNTSNFESIIKQSDYSASGNFNNAVSAIHDSYRNPQHSFRKWEYEGIDYAIEALENANITIPAVLNTYTIKCTRRITSCIKENKQCCPSSVRCFKPYFPTSEQLKKSAIIISAGTISFAAWYFNPFN